LLLKDIADKDIPTANPSDVIRQYQGWIKRIAKKYAGFLNDTGAVDTEDMIQAGNIAVLEAQKTYDPNCGSTFLSWTFKPIRNAILKLFGYDNPKRNHPKLPLIYLDEPIKEDDDDTLIETIEDPNCINPEEKVVQDAARDEIREEVRNAVERMENEQYKTVVRSVWLEGKDKKAIATDLGLSVETIRYCDLKGRGKLSQDYKLRRLAYPCFKVGMKRYRSTLTSAVELAVLWREQRFDEQFGKGAFVNTGHENTPKEII